MAGAMLSNAGVTNTAGPNSLFLGRQWCLPSHHADQDSGSRIMTPDNTKNLKLNRLSLYRGIYSRVARQLGIDPSYVSRVARGERQSAKVEAALLKEIRRIEKGAK